MSSYLAAPYCSIPLAWNIPLLKDGNLCYIHEDCSSPEEEEFPDSRSSLRFSSQTTSPRPSITHDSSLTNSSDPVLHKLPSNSHDFSHLHIDYVPENVPIKISWVDFGRHSPGDMYMPIIRSYPYPYSREIQGSKGLTYSSSSPFIEHIDITTVWKGISLMDAKTLFRIHEAFKASLQILFSDALQRLCQDFRKECMFYRRDSADDLGDSTITRKLKFSRSQLSHTMHRISSALEEQPMKSVNQDFVTLLHLYLTTCDYLMKTKGDEYQDTAIEVCAHYEEPAFCTIPPRIVVEAAWIPDMLSFGQVREIYREGDEVIIIPHYRSNSAFTPDISHRDICYSLGSTQKWLKWDESTSGFCGKVPLYSELRGTTDERFGKAYDYHDDGPYKTANILHIEVKALLTERFPPYFRLERTIRARLTIKIFPWYRNISACQHSDTFTSTISSRDSSLSSISLGRGGNLRDIWDGCNKEMSHSRSYSQGKLKVFGLGPQVLKANLHELSNGNTVSDFELASPKTRYQEIDDESRLPVLSTSCNDEMLYPDYEMKIEDFVSKPDAQEEQSSDLTRSLSEPPYLICFSPFSSSYDFQSGSSNEKEIDEKTPSVPKRVDGLMISRSQSCEEVCHQHIDHPGTLTCPMDETHFGDQDITYPNPHVMHFKKQQPQAVASTETTAQINALSPPQSSPSFPSSIRISTPPDSDKTVDLFASENRSCSDSSSLEFIIENPDVDPKLRREQAILWKVLSAKESRATTRLSTAERKDIYDAMKESAEEEERRRHAHIGAVDVLDDLFMVDGSNLDEGEDEVFSLGHSEMSSNMGSSLGSVDRELAGSVNYGF